MQPLSKMFSRTIPVATLAVIGLALSPSVHADIRYTTQMQMGDAGGTGAGAAPAGAAPAIRTTTFIKDMHERVETDMSMGPIQMHQVTLTLCDKHQNVKLDDALKIYTTSPIGVASFGPPSRPGAPGHQMPEGKPGVGHVDMTFAVQDLGTEKVADLDTHHYKVSIHMQTSGCLGAGDSTMVMEEWLADVNGGLNCPERYAESRMVPNANGCQITYDMKGDWQKMRDMQGGMVVRQKIYNGDKVIMTSDMRAYSEAALDDSLFVVPADYKEVSQKDFDKAEADAMRKNMMGGMGNMFKSPDGGDAANPNGDNANNTGNDANPPSSNAGDAANNAVDKAGDAANNAANNAGDAANNATNNASDAADKAKEQVKKKIRLPHLPF